MKRSLKANLTSQILSGLLGVALGSFLLAGCATMSLTRQDVVRQYDSVAELSDGLEATRGQDGMLLAPNMFAETKKNLDQAFLYARKADKDRANEAAQEGLDNLENLNKMVANNRQEMEEVINMRTRANLQGSSVLFVQRSREADISFRAASRMLEQGQIEDARNARPELIEMYAQLELAALKIGMLEAAEKAILAAEEADADDHAPRTLQNAREELKLAISILDADRTRVDDSNAHAYQATWLANQAREITDLIKYFESQDFSDEARLLWYQNQLQQVRSALREETLPFDQSNAKVIQALRNDALALNSVMENFRNTNQITQQWASQLEQEIESQRRAHEEELQKLLESHENQLAALNSGNARQLEQAERDAAQQVDALQQRLSENALEQAEMQRREDRAQNRFAQAQHLFSNEEAEVFRQGNNVLIRLKGFDFKPGKYEVDAINYALLNKVVLVINMFPESSLSITGHTDALGSDNSNLRLSAARAQSVVDFLSTVGGINGDRLAASGKGEEQPLASNETAEGRAENRRIDLLIISNDVPFGPASKASR